MNAVEFSEADYAVINRFLLSQRKAPSSNDGTRTLADISWKRYRPLSDRHVGTVGPIALGNWVGRVNGHPVRVYYGAPAFTVPANVQAAMVVGSHPVRFGLPQIRGVKQTRLQAEVMGVGGLSAFA